MSRRAIVFVPYFGALPEWFPLFAFSAGHQDGFEWRVYTDDPTQYAVPENVRIVPTSLEAYRARVSERLGIEGLDFEPYKLCDYKPFYGHIHRDEIGDAPYWGFGDLDLIVGDLARFLSPAMRKRADLISAHEDKIGGHLTLLRNTDAVHARIFESAEWERDLQRPDYRAIDEYHLTEVYYPLRRRIGWWHADRVYRIARRVGLRSGVTRRRYCEELFTTPLSEIRWPDGSLYWDHPLEWIWEDGRITAAGTGQEVPYLHFMNYKSKKWLADNVARDVDEGIWTPGELPEGCEATIPPWEGVAPLVQGDMANPTRIRISTTGIEAS